MERPVNYILSRKAEEDIVSIYLHGLENFGEMQADVYHSKLQACFEFLARNLLSTPERMELSPPVRLHPVGIYRGIPNNRLVQHIHCEGAARA